MKKRKLYLYNPETDNFERFYPSLKDRGRSILVTLLVGLVIAVAFYLLIFYLFETPTVENLTAENKRLKERLEAQQENVVNRLNYSMEVMRAIQERDSNFYRVIMQMDSISPYIISPSKLREERYARLKKVNDSKLISGLVKSLDSLDDALLRQSISFTELVATALQDRDKLRHIPSIIPVNAVDYTVASGYGKRIDPVYNVPKFHSGIDFALEEGTPVYATADGTVSVAAKDNKGYGNHVDIDHGYDYMTRYAHLSKIMVKQGQKVKRGELVGMIGNTGKSTGPHLHYEVHFKGEPQNPVDYYYMDLSPEQYDEIVKFAANAGHVMD